MFILEMVGLYYYDVAFLSTNFELMVVTNTKHLAYMYMYLYAYIHVYKYNATYGGDSQTTDKNFEDGITKARDHILHVHE